MGKHSSYISFSRHTAFFVIDNKTQREEENNLYNPREKKRRFSSYRIEKKRSQLDFQSKYIMSSKVKSADMEEFSKAFIIFDRDADGTVSMDELKLVRFYFQVSLSLIFFEFFEYVINLFFLS